MMNNKSTIVLIVNMILLVLSTFSLSSASSSLSSYEANFEVIENVQGRLTDVQVELKLTYGAYDREQTRDMKLVEADSIEAVEVIDGAGNPLGFEVIPGTKESKIIWNLNGEADKDREVTVRFKLPNAITEKEGRSVFGAYWVGGWVVPVEKAHYRFIFPPGYAYQECSVYPQYGYEATAAGEKREVAITIAPLKGESFALAFAPSFETWKEISRPPADMLVKKEAGEETEQNEQEQTSTEDKTEKEPVINGETTKSVNEVPVPVGDVAGENLIPPAEKVVVAEETVKKDEEENIVEEQPPIKVEKKAEKSIPCHLFHCASC